MVKFPERVWFRPLDEDGNELPGYVTRPANLDDYTRRNDLAEKLNNTRPAE